ncbi:hypothetical protein Tco_1023468 [Tanacetum coccineum]
MENPTLEEYMTKTRDDYGLGVARPKFDEKARFELKGQFLKELRNNAFSGTNGDDTIEHIKKFLKIVDLLNIPNVTHDQLLLSVFPISLTGAASKWLKDEPYGLLTTWVDLIEIFFGKYYPPSRIGRNMEANRVNTKVEWDTTNIMFENCDDGEVLTEDEFSDLEEENLSEGDEIDEIFRIEIDIFDFETPLCIPGFKTYEEYKDEWIYQWNNGIPWVSKKPLDEGFCNGGDLPGIIRIGNTIHFQDYEWYEGLEDSELKKEDLKEKDEEESSDDAWSHYSPIDEWENFERTNRIETNVNSNYNSYLDVCQIFNNHARTNNNDEIQENRECFDEHEPMEDNDNDIGDLDDYLVRNDAHFIVNEEEERSKKRRCKLLGIPYVKPPTCKSKKFKVIKYSFGPVEEYFAIKEYEYDIWVQTEENVSYVYHFIFRKKDEGWAMARTK